MIWFTKHTNREYGTKKNKPIEYFSNLNIADISPPVTCSGGEVQLVQKTTYKSCFRIITINTFY